MSYSLNPNRRGGGFYQNPSGGYRDSRSRDRYPREGGRDYDYRVQPTGRDESQSGNRFLSLIEASQSRSPSPNTDGKGKKRTASELKDSNNASFNSNVLSTEILKHEGFIKEANEINVMIGEIVSQDPPENEEMALTREILGKIGSWISKVSSAGVESLRVIEKALTYQHTLTQGSL